MNRHAIRARAQRTNGYARSVHFHLRLAGAQRAKRHRSGGNLYLEASHIHGGEPDFRVRTDANHVGGIQLHFRAPGGTGEQPVVRHERSVQCRSHHVARIAAPDRDVAIQYADARYGASGLVLAVGIGVGIGTGVGIGILGAERNLRQ